MSKDTEKIENGFWAILELFGHKVLAGYVSKDESFGAPMVRIDVPPTSRYPRFTRHYGPSAIYSISYVSEEAACRTAEAIKENPISVYVPDIDDVARLKARIGELQELLRERQALPDGENGRKICPDCGEEIHEDGVCIVCEFEDDDFEDEEDPFGGGG